MNGVEIDHIELFGPPQTRRDSTHLCPVPRSLDRSPCGTGTSAKMACLEAEGKLAPGEVWRQAGILGAVFEGSIRVESGRVFPSITGTAYVTAVELPLDPSDPSAWEYEMSTTTRRRRSRRRHRRRGLCPRIRTCRIQVALSTRYVANGATGAAMGHIVVMDDSPRNSP